MICFENNKETSLKPTIILIHGATLNGASWAPVRRELEPDFNVVAPDLPGHGARCGEKFTLDGAIAAVLAAVGSVAPAPVILVGDSLGAYTAQAAAAQVPQEQLRGLVLGGASQDFSGPRLWPYLLKGMLFKLIFALRDEQQIVADKMPGLLSSDFGMEPADVKATMDAGMSLAVFPQALKELHNVGFRKKMAAITQPILFVNGDRDTFHTSGEKTYGAAAQHATFHRFADCEHGVSLRRSAEFAGLVRQFAQRAAQ